MIMIGQGEIKMAKVIVNPQESKCFICGREGTAVLSYDKVPACSFCGGYQLVNKDGGEFIPVLRQDLRFPERGWRSKEKRRRADNL